MQQSSKKNRVIILALLSLVSVSALLFVAQLLWEPSDASNNLATANPQRSDAGTEAAPSAVELATPGGHREPVEASKNDGEPQVSRAGPDLADMQSAVDPPGKSTEEYLASLNVFREEFVATCVDGQGTSRSEILRSAWGLASQSIAAIMRAQGREIYRRADEAEGSMRMALRVLPDEWQFMSGPAKFSFPKGEFIAYDLVGERMQSQPVDPSTLSVFTEQELVEFEMLFEAAVSALESQR